MFFFWNVKPASTSILFLELFDRRSRLLDTLVYRIRYGYLPDFIVAFFGLGNVQFIHYCLCLLGIFGLLGQSVVQEDVAGLGADVSDTISRLITHLNHVSIGALSHNFNLSSDFRCQFLV